MTRDARKRELEEQGLVNRHYVQYAKDEMKKLHDDFCVYKRKVNLSTPAWDELEKIMPVVVAE